MKTTASKIRWGLVSVMGVCMLSRLSILAAPVPEGRPIPPSRSTVELPAVPPLPISTPVARFRKLLAMSQNEQQATLAERSTASRSVIERKLREYESLPPADRESRLRAMEFHHYMQALMSAPAPVRGVWLKSVPVEYLALCEERLRLWTVLPDELQHYLKEREATLSWLTRWEGSSTSERKDLLASLPQDQRMAMEKDVTRWQSMSAIQREKAWKATRHMFELSPQDQQRVLISLVESNRIPAARFVESLRQVSVSQREMYLDGFKKFSQMDVADRARYVKGWERWKQFSETERDVWRQLQARVPKPSPISAP